MTNKKQDPLACDPNLIAVEMFTEIYTEDERYHSQFALYIHDGPMDSAVGAAARALKDSDFSRPPFTRCTATQMYGYVRDYLTPELRKKFIGKLLLGDEVSEFDGAIPNPDAISKQQH